MKKAMSVFLFLTIILTYQVPHPAGKTNHFSDTKELLYLDMLMTLLGPEIDGKVNDYYSKIINVEPTVYPYQIEVIKAERIGEDRTFHFLLVLDVAPVVGPHIQVGKDRLTFELAPGINQSQYKLVKFEHLETFEPPTHWKHIYR
ncbi:MAG: DUF3888 domain-containing protein [Bacillota bacterium]